jgi:uracil-DNA glycosylase
MFNLQATHPGWHQLLLKNLQKMEGSYLDNLRKTTDWLPGQTDIFNAFSLPFPRLKRILFGESPYPRADSANGYAFWDNRVTDLWSENGLSKLVNRATSLRNFMKMLLKTEEKMLPPAAKIQTLAELFHNLLNHGFLLLNASLVYRKDKVKEDAKQWRPFIAALLDEIYQFYPETELIFFGKIAQQIDPLIKHPYKKLYAEHPYNLSFIDNKEVQDYFRPFGLLRKDCHPYSGN